MRGAAAYITQFDSCTSMLYALGNTLHEKGFKGAGVVPSGLGFIPNSLNLLPFDLRQGIYRWSGGWNALTAQKLNDIRTEEIAQWVVAQYPERRYPSLLIGSSNGGAVHLAAAMRAPWLPQTFLVAVRRKMDPDDMQADIDWGLKNAKVLRDNNPDLKINQMHDPVQDRLMIAKMAYFRIKFGSLGKTYENFILKNLEPDGTLVVVDNRLPWPMITVAERHTFQVGGLGALGPYEYLEGSPRVCEFLEKLGSSCKSWPLPGKVFEAPESEWGFYPPMGEDVERFALLEPWMTLQTGSVPFWLAFNTEPSLNAIHSYLNNGKSFDEISLMLMSNGVEGIGQMGINRWKEILAFARKKGRFLGLDETKYPLDFSSFLRYHGELKKQVDPAFRPPEPLGLADVEDFLKTSENAYALSLQ